MGFDDLLDDLPRAARTSSRLPWAILSRAFDPRRLVDADIAGRAELSLLCCLLGQQVVRTAYDLPG
jgi:hypothetical protein